MIAGVIFVVTPVFAVVLCNDKNTFCT